MIEWLVALMMGVASIIVPSQTIAYEAPQVYNHPVPVLEQRAGAEFLATDEATAQNSTHTSSVAVAKSVDCYCVAYLREVLGVNISGDAGTHKPNLKLTDIQYGDVVILNYEGLWHVGMYVKHDNEGITIKDSNYTPCTPTTRLIEYDDESLYGFYRPETA